MKILLYILAFISYQSLFAQHSFIINNIDDPELSHFSDMEYYEGRYYGLSNHVEVVSPWRVFSKLFVFDINGTLEMEISLGDYGHQYFQFHSIEGDLLKMAGGILSPECNMQIVVAEYNLTSGTLHNLSSYDFCPEDRIARRMQFVKGLNDDLFLEGDIGFPISTDNGNRSFLFKIGSAYELTPVFTNLSASNHLSIDFSQKGYLIKDSYVIDFYNTTFAKRKQRYNFLDDYDNDLSSFSHPFKSGYVLDQVYKNGGQETGEALRLLDSNFYIRDLAIIHPGEGTTTKVSFPRYGGLLIGPDQTVWSTSNFGWSVHSPASAFSITKLDTGLNILCQQFIGFEKIYRIYGISPVENNGVIVYGLHHPQFSPQWKGKEEVFAYKIGDNCDLATAVADYKEDAHAITAFPNPTINSITFDVSGFDPVSLRVEIVNTAGITVFTTNDLSYEIHVADLPAGHYFYRILQKEILLGVGSWVKQ